MLKAFVATCLVLFASIAAAQNFESAASIVETQEIQNISPAADRPLALMPLYLSFVALQMFDARSTVLAVNRGARELNPLVRWFDGDPIAITALKLGTTAGTIVLTEKLWRGHNRTAAVLSMVALNSAYAFIVAHNYRTANRLLPR
jgi:hypothetical protein